MNPCGLSFEEGQLCQVLSALANQTLIATHSSNLLERVDPRLVVRLSKNADLLTPVSPSSTSDAEAVALARYSSPETGDGFFAKKIIFVEEPSEPSRNFVIGKEEQCVT
jgi:predicted ATP-dependent endonuclease of OLD family